MKVCLLNDSFPPVIDGVVNVVMNYAKYLMEDHQASVMVGTPKYPDEDYSKYPYPVAAYPSLNTQSLASGYRTGNPFSEKAISKMGAFEPDIIHSHCPATATIISRLLREKTGAPIIFTYHTKYDIDIERVVRMKTLARETVKAMVSNIEACDAVWVVSRGAGESLKALGFRGDYKVMNNGVDFEKGRVSAADVERVTGEYDLPAGVPVFLFVGRMMTYKGLPMILDALKMLKESGQDFRMVFVGGGPDKELLENTARRYGLLDAPEGGKCIFTGPVYDRDALRAWNTRADLFLFPSTFDTNGLVVREAAACGLASILIKDSCAAEGITDGRNGFLIDENAQSMFERLAGLCGDMAYLKQVGDHAMNEIYLSWETCVNRAYEEYQIVLDNKLFGRLPEKQKLPADYLISLTARSMEEQEHRRKIRHELFHDFRESAVGMMENIQETEENIESFFASISEDIRKNIDRFF